MLLLLLNVFAKRKILSIETILAHTHVRTHARTHARTHTQHTRAFYSDDEAKFTQLKTGSKQRLEMDEDSRTEQKTWQVYSFWKRNVFRLHLNESSHTNTGGGGGGDQKVEGVHLSPARLM